MYVCVHGSPLYPYTERGIHLTFFLTSEETFHNFFAHRVIHYICIAFKNPPRAVMFCRVSSQSLIEQALSVPCRGPRANDGLVSSALSIFPWLGRFCSGSAALWLAEEMRFSLQIPGGVSFLHCVPKARHFPWFE